MGRKHRVDYVPLHGDCVLGITTSWGDGSDGDSDGNESGSGGCFINIIAYGF